MKRVYILLFLLTVTGGWCGCTEKLPAEPVTPLKVGILGSREPADWLTATLSDLPGYEFLERNAVGSLKLEHAISGRQLRQAFPHADVILLIGPRQMQLFDAQTAELYCRSELPAGIAPEELTRIAEDFLCRSRVKRAAPRRYALSLRQLEDRSLLYEPGHPLPEWLPRFESALLELEQVTLLSRHDLKAILQERELSERTIHLPGTTWQVELLFEPDSRQRNDLILKLTHPAMAPQTLCIADVFALSDEELAARLRDVFRNLPVPAPASRQEEAAAFFRYYLDAPLWLPLASGIRNDIDVPGGSTPLPDDCPRSYALFAALALHPENIEYRGEAAFFELLASWAHFYNATYLAWPISPESTALRRQAIDDIRKFLDIWTGPFPDNAAPAWIAPTSGNAAQAWKYVRIFILLYKLDAAAAFPYQERVLDELSRPAYREQEFYTLFDDLLHSVPALPESFLAELAERNPLFAQVVYFARQNESNARHLKLPPTALEQFQHDMQEASLRRDSSLADLVLSSYPPQFSGLENLDYTHRLLQQYLATQLLSIDHPAIHEALKKLNAEFEIEVLTKDFTPPLHVVITSEGEIFVFDKESCMISGGSAAAGALQPLRQIDPALRPWVRRFGLSPQYYLFGDQTIHKVDRQTGAAAGTIPLKFNVSALTGTAERIWMIRDERQILSCDYDGADWRLESSPFRADKKFPWEEQEAFLEHLEATAAPNRFRLHFNGKPAVIDFDAGTLTFDPLPELPAALHENYFPADNLRYTRDAISIFAGGGNLVRVRLLR